MPRTDVALADPRLSRAASRLGTAIVKRRLIDAQRRARAGEIDPAEVVAATVAGLPRRSVELRPVINATGVLLHTNLGRAALSEAAREAVNIAAGCADIEYDLESGRRGRRGHGALTALAEAVPAAGGVHVVNNNAAALVLAAAVLAPGREIVVSRGELVEIGDGFRLPDLLTATGARLYEVGTTNRTTLDDYARAIWSGTGLILKIHPSNFRIDGFTSEVAVDQLATLGVPVVVDIGSGLLRPERFLPDEPDADTALRQGAALVTASGDKLLGGPQAGLLLGTSTVVEQLRRHPLARAMRADKLTLAALEATLRTGRTPTEVALRAPLAALRDRGAAIIDRIAAAGVPAELVAAEATIGGGGAPGVRLPSCAISLPQRLCQPLRRGDPAVVGRVRDGRLLLDLRSVPPELDDALVAVLLAARVDEHVESGEPTGALC